MHDDLIRSVLLTFANLHTHTFFRTDFHGDGRAGLADVRLPIEDAGRIIKAGLDKH